MQMIMAGGREARPTFTARFRSLALDAFDFLSFLVFLSHLLVFSRHAVFFSCSHSNSEWVPREMFKRAMHDLHPESRNLATLANDFSSFPRGPVDQRFNVIIIDLTTNTPASVVPPHDN